MTQAQQPKPLDRRVRRTRRRLHNALIELILEQGYDTITIQNITDRADLSRATFYLHYKDKDELLVSSLEEMFDELVKSLEKPLFSSDWLEQEPPSSIIAFEHVAEYADLYKALLLGKDGVPYVIYREIGYLARVAQRQLEVLVPPEERADLTTPIEVAAQHFAGSLFALIVWWLEHDMPHTPAEMAQMFARLETPGILAALERG